MNPLVKAARATYNFFAGDAILLGSVVLAFGFGTYFAQGAHIPNVATAGFVIVLICGGLALSLGRELAGILQKRKS